MAIVTDDQRTMQGWSMDTEQYQRELDAICETMTLQAWRTPKMKLANACTLLLEGGVTPGEQDEIGRAHV